MEGGEWFKGDPSHYEEEDPTKEKYKRERYKK
jgi:hypothetical protein